MNKLSVSFIFFFSIFFVFLFCYPGKIPEEYEVKTGEKISDAQSNAQSDAQSDTQKEEKIQGIVTIFLPGFYYDDLEKANLNNFEELKKESSLGLMNVTVPGPYNPASVYLTLGSGTRGAAGENSGVNLEVGEKNSAGEKAVEVYKRNTGEKINLNEGGVVTELPELLNENKDLEVDIKPGLLGDIAKKEKARIIYHGNADTSREKEGIKRYGALSAMDSRGIISRAIMKPTKTLKEESNFPFGYKTDYQKTKDILKEMLLEDNSWLDEGQPFLYFLELGDGMRLEKYQERLTPKKQRELKRKTLKRIDGLLGELMHLQKKKNFDLIILNPTPLHGDYHRGKRLMPIIMSTSTSRKEVSEASENKGLLTSSTTKRKGLVSSIDFLPTVLSRLDIDVPLHLMGSPMEKTALASDVDKSSLEYIEAFRDKYQDLFDIRPPVLKTYIILQVITMVTGLFAPVFSLRIPFLKPFFYSMLISPFSFVLASYFSLSKLLEVAIVLLLFSLGGGLILHRLKFQELKKISFVCLITALSILLPFFIDKEIIYSSLLSHDPISGARFYGLGNELMGVFIGSFTMGIFSLYNIKASLFKTYYFWGLVPVIFFSHPSLGANFGGAISAFVVFLMILYLTFKSSKRIFYIMAWTVVAFIIFLVVINLYSPQISHLGRTFELFAYKGVESLVPIVIRKVSMNINLIRYSDWSLVFLSFIAVLFIKFAKSASFMKELKVKLLYFRKGLIGIAAGAITAFLLNDSGVVAAATMLLYASVPLMLMGVRD